MERGVRLPDPLRPGGFGGLEMQTYIDAEAAAEVDKLGIFPKTDHVVTNSEYPTIANDQTGLEGHYQRS